MKCQLGLVFGLPTHEDSSTGWFCHCHSNKVGEIRMQQRSALELLVQCVHCHP